MRSRESELRESGGGGLGHHATYRFAEEYYVGLDEAAAVAAFDDVPGFDAPLHCGAVE